MSIATSKFRNHTDLGKVNNVMCYHKITWWLIGDKLREDANDSKKRYTSKKDNANYFEQSFHIDSMNGKRKNNQEGRIFWYTFFMSKKSLIVIFSMLFLVGIVFVASKYFMGSKPTQTGESVQQKNVWEQKSTSQSCSTTPAAFTTAITNISSISKITPGNGTGDARYTYLWIKNNQKIPIFAPANGTLIKITYKVRTDLPSSMSKPDYDLAFQADCHTTYVINHITDPRADIAGVKPISEPIKLQPGSGVNDSDTLPTKTVTVQAGEQIGTTTGTPVANNFDFGIFVDNNATCPYEKFAEPIRSSWLALFGSSSCSVSGHL